METSVLKQIAGLLAERKKHRRWLVLFACMAVLVGGGTAAALRMMGQAMTQKVKVLDCRLEVHEHTQECYDKDGNLTCGYADYVVHMHNDDCYASNGELACSLPEIEVHKHTEACYTDEQILSCGQEESAGHVHSEECYTRERAGLLCQIPEHSHAAECYDENGAPVCGMEEHVHMDACYEWNEVLACQTAEGTEGHMHTAECYEAQEVLSCGKLELHVHTEECYEKIDKNAEYSEENRRLICKIPQLEEHIHSEEFGCFQTVEITGGEDAAPGDDSAQKSEEEVPEELKNADIIRTYEGEGYLVTAAYNEDAAIPEEAEFIAEQITPESNSEYYAEREEAFKKSMGDEGATMNGLFKIGFYVDGEEVEPESAVCITIQLLDENGMPDGTPVTVVHFAEEGTEVLDGGSAESGRTTFEMNSFSEVAIGYGSGERSSVYISESYEYESDAFRITFHIEGDAVPMKAEKTRQAEKQAPSEKEEESTADSNRQEAGRDTGPEETEQVIPAQSADADGKLVFTVKPLEKDSEEYEAFSAYAEPEDGSELLQLQAFSYALSYDGVQMDLSECEVTAEITPSETLTTHMKTSIQDAVSYLRGGEQTEPVPAGAEQEQEDKTEIVVSAIEMLGGAQISETKELVLNEVGGDETLTTQVEGENVAIKTETRANPSYTVQYYARLDRVDKDSGGVLELIDTSGGRLPQNGGTPVIKNLAVNADGTIKTNRELTEVYTAKPFEYFLAPSIMHINELADNGGYELAEIWVLKHEHTEECYVTESDGKKVLVCDPAGSDEAKSTSEEDIKKNWDIYKYSDSLHFTNSKKAGDFADPSNPKGYIYIDQKTVIRLVYDTKQDTYNNSAVFYDYDISNGGYRTSGNAKIIDTGEAGINSTANCGETPKYAFGNSNAGTNFGTNIWNGNELNKNNGKGYKGCTFGLVSGIEEDGNVEFNVSAPKVFGTEPQTGKTQYDDYSLDFKCDGDTYTLSAVRGTAMADLEKFGHPGTHTNIWTNNFWPMDDAPSWGAEGHDMKSGNAAEKNNLRYEPGDNQWMALPVSDDGMDHNSYFGMFYELEFDLDETYCGPLEYLFFGDDDMWVFLDGELVCDIGGVHSSVGEYVNLWDYLKNEDGTSKSGKHTLKFYYTERGASGSTCWMQFTLPSVTNKQPAGTNGRIENSLKVGKSVEHADTDQAYEFTIHFKNEDGADLPDDYSYTKYNKDDKVIGYDVIVHDGDKFTLKDGEYIMISYLPPGTTYTITEVSESDEYKVITKVDGEEKDSGKVTEGETSDTQITVEYVNNYHVYELPETGGDGLPLYTIAGAACLVLGAGFLYRKGFRERGL